MNPPVSRISPRWSYGGAGAKGLTREETVVYYLAEMLNENAGERKIELIQVLKALADGRRLLIVKALLERTELCACQLVELLQVSGASTSRHLGLLTRAGIIVGRKEGRWVYYRLLKNKALDGLFAWLRAEFAREPDREPGRKHLHAVLKLDPEELCRLRRPSPMNKELKCRKKTEK